ncbi:hypothetical protein [Alteromonas facilis]|uniref:hypothetical protein n=1 Tax=Alteromonas facilis TaxID=2048004 RepID=UPI001F0C10C0|nr:hypothetical protein [Alteromonas facilis]
MSSDNYAFQHHGEFVTRRSGQLLLFAGRGPWNDLTMKTGSRDMAGYIEQFDHSKPWAQISCIYGESLMPPSTFDSFTKHTVIRRQIGLEELAIAIIDSDIRHTIKAQLQEAYAKADVEFRFYSAIEDAIQSLDQTKYGFDLDYVNRFFQDNRF